MFVSNNPQKLFNWNKKRSAGILLHISSIPSAQGIGCVGTETMEFIDFLSQTGFKYWQICPLGPTGFGDSPYQNFSSFAGNPYFIDLTALVRARLLSQDDLTPLSSLSYQKVEYGNLFEKFCPVLQKAYLRFKKQKSTYSDYSYKQYQKFSNKEKSWLHPYACFKAIKEHFHHKSWREWPKKYQSFAQAKKTTLPDRLNKEISFQKFAQFLFFSQWQRLKQYAYSKNIEIIGDIPIYIGEDSADLWSNHSIFDLDAQGLSKNMAGIPPDYFSKNGQLWGNPLYKWNMLEKQNYKWCINRIKHNLRLCDVLRMDHFRGFYDYWAIPKGEKTAKNGQWKMGPGVKLFKEIKKHLPQAKLIAENLGALSKGAKDFTAQIGLPGMAILQFAFGGDSQNPYLLHNLEKNCVIYSGTHDNDTSWGWYNSSNKNIRNHVRKYLEISGENIPWDFIRAAFKSTCSIAIIPLQDLLSLGTEARLNHPGTIAGNWQWRCTNEQFSTLKQENSHYLRSILSLYGRL